MPFVPNINLTGVKPAERTKYPPGTYQLLANEVTIETNKDGVTQRMLIKAVIQMGPGQVAEYVGKSLWHSYNLTQESAGYLMRFVQACGVEHLVAGNSGGVNTDWFQGKVYFADVSYKKDNDLPNVGNERGVNQAPSNSQGQQLPSPTGTMFAPPQGMQQPQQFAQQAPQQQQYAAPQQQFAPQQFAPPMQQQFAPQQPQPQQMQQWPQQGQMLPAPPPPQQGGVGFGGPK